MYKWSRKSRAVLTSFLQRPSSSDSLTCGDHELFAVPFQPPPELIRVNQHEIGVSCRSCSSEGWGLSLERMQHRAAKQAKVSQVSRYRSAGHHSPFLYSPLLGNHEIFRIACGSFRCGCHACETSTADKDQSDTAFLRLVSTHRHLLGVFKSGRS